MSASQNTSPDGFTPSALPAQPVGLILGAVATVLLLGSLSQTIVSTALPTIVADLGGLDHLTWVITAYLLASTISAPIYGKLGDLYGRKIVLQSAIVVFLIGGVIAGVAQDMTMMVLGRLVQGLGGGGLMVTAMTVVADVLPARERGKAQGLLGGVFGISTVVGPLIGGFIVEHLSWHWIFFLNLPLGLAALGVITFVLRAPAERIARKIDYWGAALLTTMLSAIVLFASIGGSALPWSSLPVLALIALAIVSLIGFLFVETRAAEPILPLSLFTNNNFVVSNTVGFIVGVAMFGAITFMPLFLQVVKGVSPSQSGLMLLPMMLGLLGSSVLSGRWMSATGRYKILPLISTAALTLALALMAVLLSPEIEIWQVSVLVFFIGTGIGPVMSIGVTAIQNAVPANMLGVATASVSMFRQVGGSIGVSIFGAMFSAGLAERLAGSMPTGGGMGSMSASVVAALPDDVREKVLTGFTEALHPIFISAACVAAIGFALSFLLKEIPLSTKLKAQEAEIEAEEQAAAGATGSPSGI